MQKLRYCQQCLPSSAGGAFRGAARHAEHNGEKRAASAIGRGLPAGGYADVLREEKHYTVCFYLECPACGEVYFFGGCIRGKPIYKRVGNTRRETIDSHLCGHRLWGSEGTYYQSPPEN